MKTPFVSRSHFEDVTAELRAQIAEQKELNRTLMLRLGLVTEQIPESEEPEVAADPIATFIGRNRRVSAVVHAAEKKLNDQFREKYPVTNELDELESRGRALAHGS